MAELDFTYPNLTYLGPGTLGEASMPVAETVAYSDTDITPFWRRIPKFFLYPLHAGPLLYAVFLSAASLLIPMLGWLWWVAFLAVMIAVLKYVLRVMEQTSLGYLTPEKHEFDAKPERANLPYKMIAMMLVLGIAIGYLEHKSETLGWVANILVTLALPASIMALSAGNSFWRGVNPLEWLTVVSAVGTPYIALFVFLALLLNGTPIVLKLLSPLLGGMMTFPIVFFVAIYFMTVMFNMMGYCLYQYHHMLGLDVKVDFERNQAAASGKPVKPRDTVGEAIAAKVAEGDIKGALEAAYDQQRNAPGDVAIQERYFKLLLMGDNPSNALEQGKNLISLLLRNGRAEQAVKVFKDCRGLKPGFLPDDTAEQFKLAEGARRAGDHKLALDMARAFEKDHPRHKDAARSMLLAAQILSENMRKDDLATMVLQDLSKKYPNDPLAAEAAEYLKVLEKMAATRAAPKKT